MQFLIDIGLTLLYFSIFLLLCAWTWRFWMMYVNQKYLSGIKWVILEIKLPREITKSPLATEMALATLIQGGGVGDLYSRLFKGKLPIYSSLEIASLEGVIHFYVRTEKRFKSLVEANFYAQYPGVEIVEAEDYTGRIKYHHLAKDVSIWGNSFKTKSTWTPTDTKTGKPQEGKMPADFLPIKTYVDYELDKDPKEEFKIDPLVPLLETMGSIGKGEYMWYQILVQDESVYNGTTKLPKFYVNEKTHEHASLKDMADARKQQIRTASWVIEGDVVADDFGVVKPIESWIKKENGDYEQQFKEEKDKDGKTIRVPEKILPRYLKTKAITKKETDLTPEEKFELEQINRKMSKPLVLCVMRLMYVARSENAKEYGSQIQNVLSFAKPYTYTGSNSIGANSFTNGYSYPWQDMGGKHSSWDGENMFEAYVEREGFFPHIPGRKNLDKYEDLMFWTSTMKQRKLFRMIFEALVHPFEHPHADEAFTLNLEELATLWHLPGATAATPTLPRIDSNKGVPPTNLPV